ncbi:MULTISPECIES: thioredoxin family protein [unclassified Flavobacterium]|jgi:thioredoxin-like negative regulator of GroEL|uniref:thioredoxin family protein n=1 Tax=unclassified Flavobacterium TaxID=196869 RepID=UPI0025C5BB89|nr:MULTISPECIES: thioredoxin family protein [unclassified Flavobacterium]
MKTTVAKALFNSYTYPVYRKIVSDLLVEGKSTGNEQSENLTHYSTLNETRMNRLEKTMKITDENLSKLQSLKNEYIWLVIAEGWCADGAQLLPVFNKMANESDKIELKIVLRDENEDLMNLFLTNGTRAVPKLIIVNKETGNVCGNWGPRPKGANDLIRNYKEKFGIVDETAKADLQLWYLHDKGVSTQDELIDLMLDLEQ